MAANDSWLAGMVRDRRVQSTTLDTLSGLASGRQVFTPTPPIPVPTTDRQEPAPDITNIMPNNDVPNDNGVPSPDFSNPTTITTPSPISFNPVIAQLIVSDADFYSRTGRQPSQSDRLLMNARQSFLSLKGRDPTPNELLYEAQRGIMAPSDNTSPGIT